jgi:hypothetical protein
MTNTSRVSWVLHSVVPSELRLVAARGHGPASSATMSWLIDPWAWHQTSPQSGHGDRSPSGSSATVGWVQSTRARSWSSVSSAPQAWQVRPGWAGAVATSEHLPLQQRGQLVEHGLDERARSGTPTGAGRRRRGGSGRSTWCPRHRRSSAYGGGRAVDGDPPSLGPGQPRARRLPTRKVTGRVIVRGSIRDPAHRATTVSSGRIWVGCPSSR